MFTIAPRVLLDVEAALRALDAVSPSASFASPEVWHQMAEHCGVRDMPSLVIVEEALEQLDDRRIARRCLWRRVHPELGSRRCYEVRHGR